MKWLRKIFYQDDGNRDRPLLALELKGPLSKMAFNEQTWFGIRNIGGRAARDINIEPVEVFPWKMEFKDVPYLAAGELVWLRHDVYRGWTINNKEQFWISYYTNPMVGLRQMLALCKTNTSSLEVAGYLQIGWSLDDVGTRMRNSCRLEIHDWPLRVRVTQF